MYRFHAESKKWKSQSRISFTFPFCMFFLIFRSWRVELVGWELFNAQLLGLDPCPPPCFVLPDRLLFPLFLSPMLLSSSHVCCWQASVVHSAAHIECPLLSFPGQLLASATCPQPLAGSSHSLHCMAHFPTPLSCCRYYFCVAQFTALPGPGKQQKNIVHQRQKESSVACWGGFKGRGTKDETGIGEGKRTRALSR